MGLDTKDALAVIFANYLKRGLEGSYDQLGQSKFGEKLKNQSQSTKYLIEAILNSLSVVVDQKVNKNSLIGKVLVDVGTDAAPELARRILDGAKENLKKSENSSEIELAKLLLELSNEELTRFLDLLLEKDPQEVVEVISYLSQFDSDEILRLVLLPKEAFTKYTRVFGRKIVEFQKTKPKKKPKPTVEVLIEKIRQKRLQRRR